MRNVHSREVKEEPRSDVMCSGTPNLETHAERKAAAQEVAEELTKGTTSGQQVERSTIVKRYLSLLTGKEDQRCRRGCGRNDTGAEGRSRCLIRCDGGSWTADMECRNGPKPWHPSRCCARRTSASGGSP